MGLLAWLLFGLIAGLLARLIVPGDDPGGGGFIGIVITIVIGIIGAFIGGFIGTALGWGSVTNFDVRSMVLAVLGAIVLLVLLRALRGGGRALAYAPRTLDRNGREPYLSGSRPFLVSDAGRGMLRGILGVVKTVIELDEALARKAQVEARRRGLSLEQLAEVALAHEVERAGRPGFVTTGEGGLVPGVNLEDREQLADLIGPP